MKGVRVSLIIEGVLPVALLRLEAGTEPCGDFQVERGLGCLAALHLLPRALGWL